MSESILRVRNLRVVFPHRHGELVPIDDVSFDVRKGDILVSINGQKVASRADAVRIARSLGKDVKVVTVVIDRRGKLVTYRVDAQDPRNRRKVRYFEGFGG